MEQLLIRNSSQQLHKLQNSENASFLPSQQPLSTNNKCVENSSKSQQQLLNLDESQVEPLANRRTSCSSTIVTSTKTVASAASASVAATTRPLNKILVNIPWVKTCAEKLKDPREGRPPRVLLNSLLIPRFFLNQTRKMVVGNLVGEKRGERMTESCGSVNKRVVVTTAAAAASSTLETSAKSTLNNSTTQRGRFCVHVL